MARIQRYRVISEILTVGLIPVFYHGKIEVAKKTVKACHKGGVRTIEFTNRGDHAIDVYNELSKWCEEELPEVILGAGTIIEPSTAIQYMNAGAEFIVGPTYCPEVVKACNRRKVLYIPGCQTPTEISAAEEMGVDLVKLFPANVLTSGFIKTILGPMPHTQLIPSGGVRVEQENIAEWIGSGAVALNIGSELIRRDLLEDSKFEIITENVKRCISWIEEAKRKRRI
jgi:2-dehydro-3-deoxyphosphogluconate aldolase / (4S)-4-hydroxy-2-oxoglutarate aldolase